MRAVHERFEQRHAVILSRGNHLLALRRGDSHRLLTQDMLLRVRRRNRGLAMDWMGGGDVNRIHRRVAQQVFIRPVCLLEPMLIRKRGRLVLTPATNRILGAAAGAIKRLGKRLRYPTCANDTPSDLATHCISPSWC